MDHHGQSQDRHLRHRFPFQVEGHCSVHEIPHQEANQKASHYQEVGHHQACDHQAVREPQEVVPSHRMVETEESFPKEWSPRELETEESSPKEWPRKE